MTIIYSLCHRYWTCTVSEARYVFFGYYIFTEGVINWKNKIWIFLCPFSGCFASVCFGVFICLTNILNRSGIHNHANFKRNNKIDWSIKQSTCRCFMYFYYFRRFTKGGPHLPEVAPSTYWYEYENCTPVVSHVNICCTLMYLFWGVYDYFCDKISSINQLFLETIDWSWWRKQYILFDTFILSKIPEITN